MGRSNHDPTDRDRIFRTPLTALALLWVAHTPALPAQCEGIECACPDGLQVLDCPGPGCPSLPLGRVPQWEKLVYFEPRQTGLCEAQRENLTRFYDDILASLPPDVPIELQSFTPNSGNRTRDMAVAMQRANAIVEHFIELGLNPKQIYVTAPNVHQLLPFLTDKPNSPLHHRVEIDIRDGYRGRTGTGYSNPGENRGGGGTSGTGGGEGSAVGGNGSIGGGGAPNDSGNPAGSAGNDGGQSGASSSGDGPSNDGGGWGD